MSKLSETPSANEPENLTVTPRRPVTRNFLLSNAALCSALRTTLFFTAWSIGLFRESRPLQPVLYQDYRSREASSRLFIWAAGSWAILGNWATNFGATLILIRTSS